MELADPKPVPTHGAKGRSCIYIYIDSLGKTTILCLI